MMNFTKFRVNLYVSSAKTIIRLLKTNKILNYIWFSYPAGYQVYWDLVPAMLMQTYFNK